MGLANMIRRRRLRRTYRRATEDVAKEFVAIADGRWFITRNPDEQRTVHLGKDPVAAERCPFDHDGDGTCPWHDQSCTQPDPKAEKYLSSWSFQLGDPEPVEGPRPEFVVGVDVARETGLPTVVVLRRHADGTMEQVPATVAYERNEGAPLILKGRAPGMSTILREKLQSGAWDRDVPEGMAVHTETWEAGKPFEKARTIRVTNPIAGTERTIRVGSADDPSDRTTADETKHDLLVRAVKTEHLGRQLREEVQKNRDRAAIGYDAMLDTIDEALGDIAKAKLMLGVPTCPVHETGCPNGGRDCWKVDELVPAESAFDEGDVVHHPDGGELFTPVMPAPPIDEQIHLGSPLDSVKGALAGVRMGTEHRRQIDAFLDTITAPSERLEYHDVEGDIVSGEFLRREPVSDGELDERAVRTEPVAQPGDPATL